jgi:transposase
VAGQDVAETAGEPAELVARAAAIDVARDSGMVCTRVPHESGSGRRVQKTWSVAARFAPFAELADHLRCEGIERVVLEAASDYWRIWFYLLEAAGLQVWLVSARDVKNVPARPKTGRLDSVWLCKLNERGMLRPSFVPRTAQFPTAAHACAWAKLSPQTRQSGARTRPGTTGKGNRWLRGALGDAAMAAGKTDTYLGERYRRIRRRRGRQKAIVATARAILEIACLLISNRDTRSATLAPATTTGSTPTARPATRSASSSASTPA